MPTLIVSQEVVMRERPHPSRTPIIETLPDPPNPPHIETPVIQTQDLEYVAAEGTRVSNKGVKITSNRATPRCEGVDQTRSVEPG